MSPNMTIYFSFVTTDTDRQTSLVVVDGDVSVDELYSNMAVKKGEATAPASSSRTDQSSSELPLVPHVMVSDVLSLLQ